MQILADVETKASNDHILEIVLQEDELSWQQLIYDLVRNEEMDPWDINLSTLTQKFLEVIRKLQEFNFRVGGKLVLASALLLKIKSDRLMGADILMLDQLIASTEEDDDTYDLFDLDPDAFLEAGEPQQKPPRIFPRTPKPRQRKVSVYDLVTALEHALKISVKREHRALDRVIVQEVSVPEKHMDVSEAMNSLLAQIDAHFSEKEELRFHHLLPQEASGRDKVLTFIPLLHLTNERRVDLEQPEHFQDIHITLLDSTPVEYSEEEPIIA